MPKWLPSTFSAMPSKATGTTPSLQDNKDCPDAIITHQLLSSQTEEGSSTPLHAKIEQMLTEARVILPGAQALFGFQLAIVLTQSFEQLPSASRIVHVASLFLVALAVASPRVATERPGPS